MANLSNNRVNNTISNEQTISAKEAIKTVLDSLQPLASLTADERKSMASIDVSNKAFVEDIIAAGNNIPIVIPHHISMEAIQNDLKLFSQLDEISGLIEQLYEQIEDTKRLAGSEAYQASLSLYRSIGNAAKDGVPGTDALMAKLRKHFTNRSSPSIPTPMGTPPQ